MGSESFALRVLAAIRRLPDTAGLTRACLVLAILTVLGSSAVASGLLNWVQVHLNHLEMGYRSNHIAVAQAKDLLILANELNPRGDSIRLARAHLAIDEGDWNLLSELVREPIRGGAGQSRVVSAVPIQSVLIEAFRAVQAGDRDTVLSRWRLALSAYVARGDSAGTLRMLDAGKVLLTEALQVTPNDLYLHYLLAEVAWRSGETQEAVAELDLLVRANGLIAELGARRAARVHHLLAVSLQEQGDQVGAVNEYRRELVYRPDSAEAIGRLYRSEQTLGRSEQAQIWSVQLSQLQPTHPVRVNVAEGWTLIGYDADLDQVSDLPFVRLTLYWDSDLTVPDDRAGWYPWGKGWIQVLEMPNLLPNGAFDGGVPEGGQSIPYGFRQDPFRHLFDRSCFDMSAKTQDGFFRDSLTLVNQESCAHTTLFSYPIPADVGRWYLGAAGVYPESAASDYLAGFYWMDGTKIQSATYAPPGPVGRPRYVSWLAQAPTSSLNMWLENLGASGRVTWDNLLLVEIPIPGSGRVP